MPTTKTKPVVTLTAAETKSIRELQERVAGLRATIDRCNPDYWKNRCNELRIEVAAWDQPGPELDAKIAELLHAVDTRAHAKGGELRPTRTALRLTAERVEKEIVPILRGAASRAIAPTLEDADKAQEAQDADHKARGIPNAPCPAAVALNAKAEAVMRSASAMDLSICGL